MIRTKIHTLMAMLLAVFLLCIGNGVLNSRAVAFAATENEPDGTDILSDLCTDSNFNINAYPIDEENYTLEIIQIAESKQGELLLYVYQPAASVRKLTATSINMSLQEKDDEAATWDIYELDLLSTYDVFQKYRVKGVELSTDEKRFYNIASIFRKWQKDLDDELDEGTYNYVDEVFIRVAQFWTVYQDGDTVHYDMQGSEVIEVTEKYLGHIHYTKDILPSWSTGFFASADDGWDCWYLAFDTDRPIDKLLEADILYNLWGYSTVMGVPVLSYMSNNRKTTLKYTDKQAVEAVGAFESRHTYSFDRIQSTDQFIKDNKLTAEELKNLFGKKWVLRFAETTTAGYNIGNEWFGEATITGVDYRVKKVTVLRLEFETDGQHYNLGVLDNKQSVSILQPPGNVQGNELPWWVWLIVAVVALIILMPILSLIFPVVGQALKAVFKGVWWLITAPFRGIAALFRKRKK